MNDRPERPASRLVLLGQFGSAHGIRGDVMVRTFTAEPEAIASYGPLTDGTASKAYTLRIVRVTDKGVVARVDGVADRTAAEALRGIELYVARTKLPQTEQSEYYHADLIGLTAVLQSGEKYGRVSSVQNFGAGDLLEIERAGSPSEYIPFTNANAPVVDFAAGTVVIVPPVMTGEREESEAESDRETD